MESKNVTVKKPHVCLQIAKFRRAQSQGSVKTGERSNNLGRRSSDKGGEPIAQAILQRQNGQWFTVTMGTLNIS